MVSDWVIKIQAENVVKLRHEIEFPMYVSFKSGIYVVIGTPIW